MDEKIGRATAVNQKTVFGELLDEQAVGAELLRTLEEKLRPVSSPVPQEEKLADRLSDHHLNTAVDNQRAMNRHIKYMLDTLVV
jgi:hypothetical protein